MNIDQYVRSRVVDLGRSLESRAKIYLDMRFWIIARDAAMGTNIGAPEQELLRLLRLGVSTGAIICPISESTFMELMKQEKVPSHRIATAAIIDELSLGVAVLALDHRIGTEIAHFVHSKAGKYELFLVDELIWSKLGYALGFLHPAEPELGAEAELKFQKFCFDKMWNLSLSEIVTTLEIQPDDNFKGLATTLNQSNAVHAAELRSFAQTYKHELEGAVDLHGHHVTEIFHDMAVRDNITPPAPGTAEWEASVNRSKNILLAAFSSPETKKALRTIHIQVALHANLRWDKRRQFEGNDFFDFNHAAAALGYCDAFFTERSLRTLATMTNVALDRINNCRVTSDVQEAVQIVSELNAVRSTANRSGS